MRSCRLFSPNFLECFFAELRDIADVSEKREWNKKKKLSRFNFSIYYKSLKLSNKRTFGFFYNLLPLYENFLSAHAVVKVGFILTSQTL